MDKIELVNKYLSKDIYSTNERCKIHILKQLYFRIQFIRIMIQEWLCIKLNLYKENDTQLASLKIIDQLEKIGLKFHFSGIKKLQSLKSPVVFAANHMSPLETLILPGLLMQYTNLAIVAKEELNKQPFFSTLLKSMNTIFISRKACKNEFINLMNASCRLIEKNFSILIFPQGKRCSEFIPDNFRKIASKISSRNKICCMPIAIESSAWNQCRIFKYFGKIDTTKTVFIEFGKLEFPETPVLVQHSEIVTFIFSKLSDWNTRIKSEVYAN